MSITDMLFELPERMRNLAYTLRVWITSSITIGGNQVSIWGLLGGGVVALIGLLILISILRN